MDTSFTAPQPDAVHSHEPTAHDLSSPVGEDGAAVVAEGLTVKRGKKAILHELDFTVPYGQITGLLGPSGCGKSTMMRSAIGSQANVSGRLEVLGRPAGAAQNRRRIGYMTQAASVYTDISVSENLRFFSRVVGASSGEADRVLRAVSLGDKRRQLVRTMSGGERSRVSLAIALLTKPDLLVLDEPTVGLDPLLRRELWDLFRTLAASGTTVLVSSHVMDEAEHCDRLLLMRQGRLLADSTPDRLKTQTGCTSVEDAFLELLQ